jgi:hypothetical protein
VKAYAVALFPPIALAVTLELVAILAARTPLPLPAPAGDDPGEDWETDRESPPDWWATAPAAAPSTVAEYTAARGLAPGSPASAPASPAPAGDRATAGDDAGEHREIHPTSAGDPTADDRPTTTPGDGIPAGHHASPAAGAHPASAPGEQRETPGDVGDDTAQPDPQRVAALLADGAGRRRLSRELDITEHEARRLLSRGRNGHPSAEATR